MPLVDKGNLTRCASLQWPGLPIRLGQLQHGNLHGPWCLPQRYVCMSVQMSFLVTVFLTLFRKTRVACNIYLTSRNISICQTVCVHMSNVFSLLSPHAEGTPLIAPHLSEHHPTQCSLLLPFKVHMLHMLVEVIQALIL